MQSLLALWSLSPFTHNRLLTALCSLSGHRSPLAALTSRRSLIRHLRSPLSALCSLCAHHSLLVEDGALVAIKQQAFTGFRAANIEFGGTYRREVDELYGSEKSFVVEVERDLSGLPYTALIALESIILLTVQEDPIFRREGPNIHVDAVLSVSQAKLRRRRLKLTQGTPDQPVDDEAVYLNVVGKCPKGRVYSLRSLGRKKRRYADHGASTSQMSEMVPRAEFDIVAEQLRKAMAFMHQQFGITIDGAGLSQPQPPPPPPPPPHDQQQPLQIDPADPPQQQDNVEREMQDWLTRYEQLGLEVIIPNPLVHISHCKATPDLIYGCVPPLLAYVQQLESSRVKLTQLEQELQRARKQGIFISSSGDQSHSLSGNGNPESISAYIAL
ncbi:hypothetical protein Syun_029382 [Stephania yunnanensis]|uniref:Uncharacterized protein n=1 Tax=Stephania yunnanensis TaxID=152371 RepID=A0AAP0E8H8_9MAGN